MTTSLGLDISYVCPHLGAVLGATRTSTTRDLDTGEDDDQGPRAGARGPSPNTELDQYELVFSDVVVVTTLGL